MSAERASAVVVGGGVIGCATALQLRRLGAERVVVLERDASYRRASSRLAFGGVRQQFCSPVNVALAREGAAFYRRFDTEMAVGGRPAHGKFRARGYLFLADAASAPRLEARFARMRALGVAVERLEPEQIREKVPELALSDIAFGLFGPEDGYGDPVAVLAGFRAKAEELGVEFVEDEVAAFETAAGRICSVVTRRDGPIQTPVAVCATGAYSAALGRLAGLEIPVTPVRQQLVRAVLPRPWPYEFPVVIDPNGVHWRSSEYNTIVIARSETDQPEGELFEPDADRFERLRPALVRRVPEFAGLQPQLSWAGLYEMTPDHNGLLGWHPDRPGLLLACGFSGHGLMMAPATGRIAAEMALDRAPSIDVRALRPERFREGEPLHDEALI